MHFTYQVPKIQLHVHQPDKIQAVSKLQLKNTPVLVSAYDLILLILVSNAAERVYNISQERQQLSAITEVR